MRGGGNRETDTREEEERGPQDLETTDGGTENGDPQFSSSEMLR